MKPEAKNKKILFVIDKYDSQPYIRGICVRNVVKCLREKNQEVHVLAFNSKSECEGEEKRFVHYFFPGIVERMFIYADDNIESNTGKIVFRIAQILSKTRKLLMLHWYPIDSFLLPRRILAEIEKLYNEFDFDLLVTVQSRIAFSMAGYLFKMRHPNKLWSMYCIDSFADGYPIKYISDQRRIEGGKRLDKKFLSVVDNFYIVDCHKKFYEQPYYDEFREKIQYVDIPLYLPVSDIGELQKKTEKGKWIYTGSLHEYGYNPWKLCKYFLALPVEIGKKLLFYSRGDCENGLIKLSEETNGRIQRCGYVAYDILKHELESADVFVSVGIEDSSQVSGKIFDYFRHVKRVVHFSSGNEDPNLKYIKSYPYAFCVEKDSKLDVTIDRLIDFLKKDIEINNDIRKEIDHIFIMNQPVYIANLIISSLE